LSRAGQGELLPPEEPTQDAPPLLNVLRAQEAETTDLVFSGKPGSTSNEAIAAHFASSL
jgi:hypothetical protein